MKLEVREISPAVMHDFFILLSEPEFCGCYCRYWQFEGDNIAWAKVDPEANRQAKKAEIAAGRARGALFYLEGKPVGWCQFAHRSFYKKMNNHPSFVSTAGDNVWSIVCLAVSKKVRKKGVSKQMLEEVLKRMAQQGGKAAEAYPRKETKLPDDEAWMGPRKLYEDLGFVTYQETPRFLIMRKNLEPPK